MNPDIENLYDSFSILWAYEISKLTCFDFEVIMNKTNEIKDEIIKSLNLHVNLTSKTHKEIIELSKIYDLPIKRKKKDMIDALTKKMNTII
tara:strand:+ start:29 stop:301 length:273 start_codon:yes stop_codon:yes gene_type:complete